MKIKNLIRYLLLPMVMFGFVNLCFANRQQMRPGSIQEALRGCSGEPSKFMTTSFMNKYKRLCFLFHTLKVA